MTPASAAAPAGTGFRTVFSMLEANHRRFPDKQFVQSIDQGKSIAHGEAFRLCNRIAGFLDDRGIQANDRVVLLGGNSLEFVLAYLGVLRHGATICTVNVEMNEARLAEIVDALHPRLVLWEDGWGVEELAAKAPGEWMALGDWRPDGSTDGGTGLFAAAAQRADTDPVAPVGGEDDIAIIFYTSGTSATAKGVIIDYGCAFYNTEAFSEALDFRGDERILEYRSFTWYSAQLMGMWQSMLHGATLIMARKFSQSRYFDWIKEYDISIAVGIPTVINMLLSRPVDIHARDLPQLRFMTSSSAPLLAHQWETFERDYGIRIAQCYGSSEGGWTTGSSGETRRIGTVGRPLRHQELRIVGADGAPVAPGDIGEIELGGGMQQYYGYLRDDGTIERFNKGRFRTGDLGCLDDDGYLRITGRAKDMIIRGGVNISPAEIENIMAGHPEIAESVAIGVADEIYGEEVVSYVVVMAGKSLTREDILDHCEGKLPAFRTPKEIVFIDAIPKNHNGKIDRNALVKLWQSR